MIDTELYVHIDSYFSDTRSVVFDIDICICVYDFIFN